MQTGTATHAKRDPGWSRLQCTHQSQLQCGQRCSRHPERLCHETTLQKGGGGGVAGLRLDSESMRPKQTGTQTDKQTDRHGQTRTDTDKNKPGGNVARRVSSKVLTRMVGCGRLCSRRCRCRCRCRCCLPSCTPSSVSSASRTRAAARVSPLASPASAASALAVPVLVVLVEDLSSCVRMLLLLRLRRLLRDAWLGRCWSPVSVL